jgi:uncharacterized membrane protein
MNNDNFGHGRGFFPGPALNAHPGGGPSSLAWVIFALELLMLAALAVLLVRAFAWRPRPAGPDGPRRHFAVRRHGPPPPADPLEVARYRYARGELSRDDYLQVVRDLEGRDEALPAD